MLLDEEIFLGNFDKCLKKVWKENYNKIFYIVDEELSEEANILNIKYTKRAELLREYNYMDKFNTLLKNNEISTDIAYSLKEGIERAYELINKDDIESVEEGYNILSNFYCTFQGNILESMRKWQQFVKADPNPENQPKEVKNYIKGKSYAPHINKEKGFSNGMDLDDEINLENNILKKAQKRIAKKIVAIDKNARGQYKRKVQPAVYDKYKNNKEDK